MTQATPSHSFLIQEAPRRWVLPEHRVSVPLMYSIRARKLG